MARVPAIKTERLILRRWKRSDAGDYYEFAKNPNVGPAAGWRPHANAFESRMVIVNTLMYNYCWAIVDKESGKVIGSIGLDTDKFRRVVKSRELGYSLSEEHWGKGIATEAAEAIIKYAFEKLWLDALMIKTSEDNIRSQRVIEKCGFSYEGTLRKIYRNYDGTVMPMRVYSMLREEYYGKEKRKDT